MNDNHAHDAVTPSVNGTAAENFPVPGTEAWGVMNHRRWELIHKKVHHGLTAAEAQEFDYLQEKSWAALKRAFPLPAAGVDDLNRLEERLRAESELPVQ